ncbi:MAG: hypothetical protein ACLQSR_11155 [Limisphaerales bacterium]
MNNKETKEQSSELKWPNWKQVRISPEVEALAKKVVDSVFTVHSTLGRACWKALMKYAWAMN